MALLAALLPLAVLYGGPSDRPANVVFHFEDVDRFVAAYEASDPGNLEGALQTGYIQGGTVGMRDFIPGRIRSAANLAATARMRPHAYEGLDRKAIAIRRQIPAMRHAMENLKRRYPAAQFPDVYFVVGALSSGGTATRNGLILGIEHEANDPGFIVPLVAHELVHYQQKGFPKNILERSVKEGSADFVGELVSGRLTPHAEKTRALARPREQAFWEQFQRDMEGLANQDRWLFNAGQGTPEWPSDLGYWFGYEISRDFYEAAIDKNRALADLLEATDYGSIFVRSGYATKLKRRGS